MSEGIGIVAERIGKDQLDRLATFLRSEELPDDDIAEPGRHFFFFRDTDGNFLGMGGFEIYGSDALLRSIVTVPEVRGQGYGAPMVGLLLEEMRAHGANSIYLLTTGAEGFFERLGFDIVERDSTPDSIQATREFTLLCPTSATMMHRTLV